MVPFPHRKIAHIECVLRCNFYLSRKFGRCIVVAPFFNRGMAAAIERQILASQKFLGTVRHLPSFADSRDKQGENLLKKISKTPLQVEQAAVLVDRLDASIWGSHVDALGRASGSCRKARGLPRPWKSCSVSLVRKTKASSR